MSYTTNPYAPKARKLATNLVKTGMKKAEVARMYGVHRSTIGKWLKRATKHSGESIPTRSSRPHRHPNQLSEEKEARIVALRLQTGRCAQIIQAQMARDGCRVSLSSVKRTLKRCNLTHKKRRQITGSTKFKRPVSDTPGALVEVDTIHFVTTNYERFYVYAVIDTYSRVGYAEYQPRLSTRTTTEVLERALRALPLPVEVIQTDNGHEFGQQLSIYLKQKNIRLRHTRVHKPNDNAHVERFIRTIQEECFDSVFPKLQTIEHDLKKYIDFYNKHRLHLGIQCKTPIEMLPSS